MKTRFVHLGKKAFLQHCSVRTSTYKKCASVSSWVISAWWSRWASPQPNETHCVLRGRNHMSVVFSASPLLWLRRPGWAFIVCGKREENCNGWKGKGGKGEKGQPPFPGLHPGLDTEEKMRSILCQNTREKKVCQCLLAA